MTKHLLKLVGLALLFVGLFLAVGTRGWGWQESAAPLPGLADGAGAKKGESASGEALVQQIRDALAKGRLSAAEKLVPEFLAQPGLPVDTLLRTGNSLAQSELYSQAADVFGRCVRDFPEVFEGHYDLALAELALTKYSEALATLSQAPRTSPEGEVARIYLLGKIESALGQNAKAERDLSTAFAANPREENYALDLGLTYIGGRKYQPAVEVFTKAAGFHKDSPLLLLGLGLAQFLGGLKTESIETCHTVLGLHPDFSPARVLLAFALTMQGNVDEAAQVAARGLHDPNPFPYLYYIHAVALLKQQSEDYDVILKDLALAEQSIPACALCYLAQSKAHQKMGTRDAAATDLGKAVGLDSTLAEAWYRLASLYDQEGRHAEAQQARSRFERLKENKADRETEVLRDVFVKALRGEGSP